MQKVSEMKVCSVLLLVVAMLAASNALAGRALPSDQAQANVAVMARFYSGQALTEANARHRLARLLLEKFTGVGESFPPLSPTQQDEARALVDQQNQLNNPVPNAGKQNLVQRYQVQRFYGRYQSLLSDLAHPVSNSVETEMNLWAQLSESLVNPTGHQALTALIQAGQVKPIDWIETCPGCLAEGRQTIGRYILTSILVPYLRLKAEEAFQARFDS
nr:hypothetical protein [uncultured Cohaesibacter sp.]